MASPARRRSVYIGGFKHANPIPNACRIGNLLMSGVILGRDQATGTMPKTIEGQCANMFAHMKAIVEAGGGTTDDIIKMTVWLQDRTQRAPVNAEWVKMFPDEHTRPAATRCKWIWTAARWCNATSPPSSTDMRS